MIEYKLIAAAAWCKVRTALSSLNNIGFTGSNHELGMEVSPCSFVIACRQVETSWEGLVLCPSSLTVCLNTDSDILCRIEDVLAKLG